jgi:hypothetical protein
MILKLADYRILSEEICMYDPMGKMDIVIWFSQSGVFEILKFRSSRVRDQCLLILDTYFTSEEMIDGKEKN